MNSGSASPDQDIHQLKQDWDQLRDVDRARRVADIKNSSGLAQREIARRLDCSEATLRRLLSILHAPAADLAAARQGEISINELVRRAKGHAARRQAQHQRAAKVDAQNATRKAADSICRWMVQENIYGPDGEFIIGEVRRDRLPGTEPKPACPQIPQAPARRVDPKVQAQGAA